MDFGSVMRLPPPLGSTEGITVQKRGWVVIGCTFAFFLGIVLYVVFVVWWRYR